MSTMMRLFFGLLLSLVSAGHCARILAILPVPVRSHYVVMEPLLQALASRGHQLTVFSSFPQKAPLANFTDIDCSQGRPIHVNNFEFNTMKRLCGNPIKCLHHTINLMAIDCEAVYKTSQLKSFDHKIKNYDLIISEMFAGDCFVHFAHKMGTPLVSIVTSIPLPWAADNFGLPDNPSYIPNYLTPFPPAMTLFQRFINTVTLIYAKVFFNSFSNWRIQELAEEYFQERLPWVGDVARNSSLLLVNSHFSISYSRPLPPNVIDIGGIHIKEKKPLPKDLQDILDRSTQGVILFSFGSMVRISSIPKEKTNMMLKVFAQIPQTVLMKYEDNLDDLPKNIIIRSWLPQRDILEHRNVVAFVSHGGLASVMEAVFCAKPLLGVPFFADQFLNINNVVGKGAGVAVDMDTMSEQDFKHAVDEVLNNPKIKEGMRRLSAEFRDRPMSALQSAVYWTEYVLRHRGAPHLRPASTSLSFYQRWLLDVIAVLVAALVAVCCAAYVTAKHIISFTKSRVSVRPESVKKDD